MMVALAMPPASHISLQAVALIVVFQRVKHGGHDAELRRPRADDRARSAPPLGLTLSSRRRTPLARPVAPARMLH